MVAAVKEDLPLAEGDYEVVIGWAERDYTSRGRGIIKVDFLKEDFPTLYILATGGPINFYRAAWARRHRLLYDAQPTLVPQDPSWLVGLTAIVRIRHIYYEGTHPGWYYRADLRSVEKAF